MSNTAYLHGAEVLIVDDGARPIRTVKQSVIGLVGVAGKGPVNTATLIAGSRREAVAQFGAWGDDGFSIPEALDGIFDQTGAVVIVINVCDPAKHTSEVEDAPLVFAARTQRAQAIKPFISDIAFSAGGFVAPVRNVGAVQLPIGATLVSVSYNGAVVGETHYDVAGRTITPKNTFPAPGGATYEVAYTATVSEGVDYTVNRDTGVFQRANGGKIMPGASTAINFTHVDPSKVTHDDIVGGVDAETGNHIGVHALLDAKSTVHAAPKILIAPRYTHQKETLTTINPAVAELQGIAERLKAIVVADGPNTTDENAITSRRDFDSKRIYMVDPWVKVDHPADGLDTAIVQPASARVAGVIARTDNDKGFWWSPSNQLINGIIGTARAVQYDAGDTSCRANYLNENAVTTIIRDDGFRLWGNHTLTTDAKWAFLSVVRTADAISESILHGHRWAQDRPISKTLITDIVEGVNAYIRHLISIGAILGGKAWADPEANTNAVLASGQLYVDFEFTAPTPAERLTFRLHLVNDYFAEIFA